MSEDELEKIKADIVNIKNTKIQFARECEQLAEEISRTTARQISSTTIRRLFGLLKSNSKLSKYNVETLIKYIENNKKSFLLQNEIDLSLYSEDIISEINRLYRMHGGFNKAFLDDLLTSNLNPTVFMYYLQSALTYSIKKRDLNFLKAYFQLPPIIISRSEFFRHIGKELVSLKVEHEFLDQLAQIKSARLYLFELYVNFGDFRYYKRWLIIYIKNEPSDIKKMWAMSILNWGFYLSRADINWQHFIKLHANAEDDLLIAHPYVKARIYGIALANCFLREGTVSKIQNLIYKDIEDSAKNPDHFPYFTQLIYPYLLIISNVPETLLMLSQKVFTSFRSYKLGKTERAIGHYENTNKALFNSSCIAFEEIKHFDTGHTNENQHMKLFLLNLLLEAEPEHANAKKYKEALIEQTGFIRFQ